MLRGATRSALRPRKEQIASDYGPSRTLSEASLSLRGLGVDSNVWCRRRQGGRRPAQSDTFLIVLTAFAGPRHPKNCNVFVSSAFVASKNFSNSFVARDGSRRMSCRSPSKGERSGTTNTRSFRSFLPFDDCRTSSTPMGLHVRTRPVYVAAS